MTNRYGNTRVAKIKAAYNDLRAAIRAGDIEAAERALDRYEPWADYVFGQTVSTWVANDASAALAAMLNAERAKAYERAERALWELLCDDGSEFWSGHTKAVKEGIEAMQSLADVARALAQEDGE